MQKISLETQSWARPSSSRSFSQRRESGQPVHAGPRNDQRARYKYPLTSNQKTRLIPPLWQYTQRSALLCPAPQALHRAPASSYAYPPRTIRTACGRYWCSYIPSLHLRSTAVPCVIVIEFSPEATSGRRVATSGRSTRTSCLLCVSTFHGTSEPALEVFELERAGGISVTVLTVVAVEAGVSFSPSKASNNVVSTLSPFRCVPSCCWKAFVGDERTPAGSGDATSGCSYSAGASRDRKLSRRSESMVSLCNAPQCESIAAIVPTSA